MVAGLVAPWRLAAYPAEPLDAVRSTANSVFRVGGFRKIYDPSIGEKERWYINDHTFIRAENGEWHLLGITHQEPANALAEKFLAHATAPDLKGPWTKQAAVLQVDERSHETVVWAPYVLRHEGVYWMYYCAGGNEHTKYHIHLATSADLWNWKRHPANPMEVDGYDARDPMVLQFGDRWLLYYTATSKPEGGNHTVNVVTSPDLSHWSNRQEVFRDLEVGTSGGPTESPFVVARNGKYYLFVCTNHGYNETAVYESETPFHWDAANLVGKFPAHAVEVIQTPDGKWFVSRAGWGQGGVYLAELTWEK
jgi:arabinan endo-1,5-alpha-L-arabinosidase